MLMSVILRPGLPLAALTPLSMLVALAVRETALACGIADDDVRIKWPNDVLVQGRKVSGILARTHQLEAGEPPVVVLGIGLNVNVPESALPETGISFAAALGQHDGLDLDAVRVILLERLDSVVGALMADDIDPWLDALNRVLAFRGEVVDVQDAGRLITGTVMGVDRSGALLLAVDGQIRSVVSGDLTRGPRPHTIPS